METRFNCILCKKYSSYSKNNTETIHTYLKKNNIYFKYNGPARHFHEVFNLRYEVSIDDYVCEECQKTPEYKLNEKKMILLYDDDLLAENLRERKSIEEHSKELKTEIEEIEKMRPS